MTTQNNDHNMQATVIPRDGSMWDFLLPIVEFFGILVPGLFFLVLLVPALLMPVVSFLEFARTGEAPSFEIYRLIIGTIKDPGWAISIIALISSYVAGHIFYRRDPKIPDERSFHRLSSGVEKHSGPVRICDAEVDFNRSNNEINPTAFNLEFPYRYLHEYLVDRGLSHLANFIHWRGNDPSTYSRRTKHFINALKVRLEFSFPYQYIRLQKNEAHVRLMSSI